MLNDVLFFGLGFILFVVALPLWLARSVYLVAPGQVLVVWRRRTNVVQALHSGAGGVHFLDCLQWACLGQGPFVGLLPSTFPHDVCPTPGSRVVLDPPRIEILSTDGIPGFADVALQLEVLPWMGKDLVGRTDTFKSSACIAVNQWMCQELSQLTAKKLCSYAEVTAELNSDRALYELNARLECSFLQAKRVSLDPGGIQLHHDYTKTLALEITKRRQVELNRLDGEAARAGVERNIALSKLEFDAKQVQLKAEQELTADRARMLLTGVGLTPAQVGNLLAAEIAAKAIASAGKVVVGMPAGLAALHGVDHVWEKV